MRLSGARQIRVVSDAVPRLFSTAITRSSFQPAVIRSCHVEEAQKLPNAKFMWQSFHNAVMQEEVLGVSTVITTAALSKEPSHSCNPYGRARGATPVPVIYRRAEFMQSSSYKDYQYQTRPMLTRWQVRAIMEPWLSSALHG